MSGRGCVISVDQVTTKGGASAWQIITDADNRSADGLNRCAIWIPRPGPVPPIGSVITWSARQAAWQGDWVRKIENEFDPSDPALFTG